DHHALQWGVAHLLESIAVGVVIDGAEDKGEIPPSFQRLNFKDERVDCVENRNLAAGFAIGPTGGVRVRAARRHVLSPYGDTGASRNAPLRMQRAYPFSSF